MAKGSASGFEDSLEALKQQCAENERVIKQLSTAKSDLNGKITALQKEKGQVEMDLSKSRQETKDLKEKLAEMDKKGDGIYQRLNEAMVKITKLEKDAELQDEVLKKRHEEISSLLKENTKYKSELDNIRKQFGNMGDIETRIKVAELKEEKINGLLT